MPPACPSLLQSSPGTWLQLHEGGLHWRFSTSRGRDGLFGHLGESPPPTRSAPPHTHPVYLPEGHARDLPPYPGAPRCQGLAAPTQRRPEPHSNPTPPHPRRIWVRSGERFTPSTPDIFPRASGRHRNRHAFQGMGPSPGRTNSSASCPSQSKENSPWGPHRLLQGRSRYRTGCLTAPVSATRDSGI